MSNTRLIRITSVSEKKLEDFTRKKSYKSRSECIETMIDFFIENAIDPTATINLNLQSSLIKMNDDFLKRDDSFRKWFGQLYNKKIGLVLKQQEDILKQNEEIKNVLINNFSLNIVDEIKEKFKPISNENIKQNTDNILIDDMHIKFEKVIESKEKIINDLQTKLNILILKTKEEKTTFGKQKFVIELTPIEFENIKKV